MLVHEVMNKDVKTVAPNSTIKDAAEQMKEFRIGSLVVVNNAKLVGILTERDILDKVVATAENSSKMKVKDVMTTEVVMIRPDLDVSEAAEIMVEKKIKKLPVVKGNKLVGIVTASDICAAEPKLMEQIGVLMLVPREKKRLAG